MIINNDDTKGKITLQDVKSNIQYELPGILQKISVLGNTDLSVTEPYQDKTISIELILQDTQEISDVYEILAQLEALFKKEETTEPIKYNVYNPHLNNRKINTITFQSLRSEEDSSTDTIHVTLIFEEYSPISKEESTV
ncbi:MAG: hypothetical protein ACRC0X_01900 [Brevinema sp.]